MLTSKYEYDAGNGRNTGNDFYQTLGSTNTIGRYFSGYTTNWNWMNYYAHADYTYNNILQASVNMAIMLLHLQVQMSPVSMSIHR